LCGVIGFRPSIGRYSQNGIVLLSHTRDSVSVFAKNVDNICLMDNAIKEVKEEEKKRR